ncbi:hypothetical protein D3C72_1713550 [compost metagenome]
MQAPFPLLDFTTGLGLGKQHRPAARDRAGPGQLIDTAGIAGVGGLDQITEGNVQGFGHPVEGGQADVLFPCLDRHQHSTADTGLFGQRGLAQVGGMT